MKYLKSLKAITKIKILTKENNNELLFRHNDTYCGSDEWDYFDSYITLHLYRS